MVQRRQNCVVRTFYCLFAAQLGHHGLLSEDDHDLQSRKHEYTLMINTTVHYGEDNCRWIAEFVVESLLHRQPVQLNPNCCCNLVKPTLLNNEACARVWEQIGLDEDGLHQCRWKHYCNNQHNLWWMHEQVSSLHQRWVNVGLSEAAYTGINISRRDA